MARALFVFLPPLLSFAASFVCPGINTSTSQLPFVVLLCEKWQFCVIFFFNVTLCLIAAI